MKRTILLLLTLLAGQLILGSSAKAQSIFSLAGRNYLADNPAYAGAEEKKNFILASSNLLPYPINSLDAEKYTKYYIKGSFEMPLQKINSGVSIVLSNQEYASMIYYRARRIGLGYDYKIRLGENIGLRTGIRVSVMDVLRTFDRVTWWGEGDNIFPKKESYQRLGLDLGMWFTYKKSLYAGIASSNYNEEIQSYFYYPYEKGPKYRFPGTLNFIAGNQFILSSKWKIDPAIRVGRTHSFTTLDLAARTTFADKVWLDASIETIRVSYFMIGTGVRIKKKVSLQATFCYPFSDPVFTLYGRKIEGGIKYSF